MNIRFVLLFLILSFYSCKENTTSNENTETSAVEKEVITPVVKDEKVTEPTIISADLNNRSRNMKLLQGLWENIGDPAKRVEFKNTKKIDIMEGVQADEGTVFSITDKCEQTNINIQGESKQRFISILSLNQCYYISQLNGKILHLGDMSTGKTIKYKKVTPAN